MIASYKCSASAEDSHTPFANFSRADKMRWRVSIALPKYWRIINIQHCVCHTYYICIIRETSLVTWRVNVLLFVRTLLFYLVWFFHFFNFFFCIYSSLECANYCQIYHLVVLPEHYWIRCKLCILRRIVFACRVMSTMKSEIYHSIMFVFVVYI